MCARTCRHLIHAWKLTCKLLNITSINNHYPEFPDVFAVRRPVPAPVEIIRFLSVWPFTLRCPLNILPWTVRLLCGVLCGVAEFLFYDHFLRRRFCYLLSYDLLLFSLPLNFQPSLSPKMTSPFSSLSLHLAFLYARTFCICSLFPCLSVSLPLFLSILFFYGEPVKESWWSWLWPLVWQSKMTLPISLTCRKQRRQHHRHQPIRNRPLRRGTRQCTRALVLCVCACV